MQYNYVFKNLLNKMYRALITGMSSKPYTNSVVGSTGTTTCICDSGITVILNEESRLNLITSKTISIRTYSIYWMDFHLIIFIINYVNSRKIVQ